MIRHWEVVVSLAIVVAGDQREGDSGDEKCGKGEDEGYLSKVNLMRQREASSAFDISFQRCFTNCDDTGEGKSICFLPVPTNEVYR